MFLIINKKPHLKDLYKPAADLQVFIRQQIQSMIGYGMQGSSVQILKVIRKYKMQGSML